VGSHGIAWLFFGIAVSAAYWPGLPAEALAPRWAIIAVGVPLLSRLDPKALGGGVSFLLLWLIGLGCVSLIASPDPWGGALELFYAIILSLALLAAASLDDLDAVMTGLGIGLIPSSMLAIGQWLGWHPVAQGSGPPPGLFYNSEVLAEFSAILFVWASVRRRWWMIATTAIPLFLCQSRIAVIVATLGLLYAVPVARWIKASGALLVMAGGAATLAILGADKVASAGTRVIVWLAMGEAITPLGRGLGWVGMALPVHQFAHSDALQAVVEMGYGAVFLAIIPFLAFWRKRGNIAERAAFFAVCAEILVSFPLRVPATGFVAAALAGVLVGRGSMVRMGELVGGGDAGPRIRWARSDWARIHGPCGWRGRAFPVRSRHSQEPHVG
jgi:hypothetical protein